VQRNPATIAGLVVIGVQIVVIAALVIRADSARAPGIDTAPTPAIHDEGAITRENAKPGTSDWRIDRPALDGEVQAYAGQVSVQPGETLDVYVSTKTAGAKYEADVYRMGWYGGAGARNVRSIRNIDGENQGRWDPLRGLQECKTCKFDPATLLVEASWKRSLQIKVEKDWVSGYYLVKLHELASNTSTYAIFIVRDDASEAPIVVQASTNTWQAYNTWGDASLYGSIGADRQYVANTRRAYRVSYDRPYDPTLSGARNEFFGWEYNYVRWAESQGYDMTYTTNVDVSLGSAALTNHKLFVSLGHDEYWTKQHRDAGESARDAGENEAFFSGNEAYWQGRLEASSAGVKSRVLTVYKDAALDPLARTNPKEATVKFADPPVSRPQSMLSGVAFGSNIEQGYVAWRPMALDSWVFTGSGVTGQDSFPGIVGYEYDHPAVADQRPAGLQIIGLSAVSGSDTSVSAMYVASSGATVFAAGTIAWSWGLDDFGHEDRGTFADDRLRRITKNILDRLGAPPAPAAAP